MGRTFRPWKRGNNKANTRSRSNIAALPLSAGAAIEKATGVKVTGYNYGQWREQGMTKEYTAVNPIDKNLLFLTLSVQSESRRTHWMEKFIFRFVQKLQIDGQVITCAADKAGNIYITKGVADLYPTMVSHMDTVHDIVPGSEYQVRSDGTKMWAVNPKDGKDTGIGGDDKVGVFVTLSLLRALPVFKAAFFVDEEIGCVGSNMADMTFFDDSSLVLQCDRKGANDFVDNIMGTDLYGEGFSQEVEPILDAYGYDAGSGGMTDVWQLKENGLTVACANMSAGYFNPHSRWEYVGLNDVQRCYDLCYAIMTKMGNRRWEHINTDVMTTNWNSFTSDDEAYYHYWMGKESKKERSLYRDDYWNSMGAAGSFGRDTRGPGYLESASEFENSERATESLRERYPDLKFLDENGTATRSTLSVSQLLADDRALLAAQKDYMEWEGRENVRRVPACPDCGSTITVVEDDEGDYWCVGCDVPVVIDTEFSVLDDDETAMPNVNIRGSIIRLHA